MTRADVTLVLAFACLGAVPALVRARPAPSREAPPVVAAPAPPSAQDERRRGVDLVRAGRHAEGRALLERHARGADAEACLALARAYAATGAPREALLLLEALASDPRASAEAEEALARALVEHDPARALPHAEAATQRGVACYDLLARCYAATGEPEAAAATIEACLDDPAAPAAAREACRALAGP